MLARESIENEPQIMAPRVTSLQSRASGGRIRVLGVENPQGFGIYERRLNASSFDIQDSIFEVNNIFGVAFGKNQEWYRNRRLIGLDQNQSGIKRKPLSIISDKSRATNLRLSAFICGLIKSLKTRQPYYIFNILISNEFQEAIKI